jgi:hypothetical protein
VEAEEATKTTMADLEITDHLSIGIGLSCRTIVAILITWELKTTTKATQIIWAAPKMEPMMKTVSTTKESQLSLYVNMWTMMIRLSSMGRARGLTLVSNQLLNRPRCRFNRHNSSFSSKCSTLSRVVETLAV